MSRDNGIFHLYFEFGHTRVLTHYHDKVSGEMSYVIEEDFHRCQGNIEQQVFGLPSISLNFFNFLLLSRLAT